MSDRHTLKLKWGTLKGWSVPDGKPFELLQEFFAEDSTLSAMDDRPDERRRKILCDLIDSADWDRIQNDWSGEEYTKEEAKAYIMNYGKGD